MQKLSQETRYERLCRQKLRPAYSHAENWIWTDEVRVLLPGAREV